MDVWIWVFGLCLGILGLVLATVLPNVLSKTPPDEVRAKNSVSRTGPIESELDVQHTYDGRAIAVDEFNGYVLTAEAFVDIQSGETQHAAQKAVRALFSGRRLVGSYCFIDDGSRTHVYRLDDGKWSPHSTIAATGKAAVYQRGNREYFLCSDGSGVRVFLLRSDRFELQDTIADEGVFAVSQLEGLLITAGANLHVRKYPWSFQTVKTDIEPPLDVFVDDVGKTVVAFYENRMCVFADWALVANVDGRGRTDGKRLVVSFDDRSDVYRIENAQVRFEQTLHRPGRIVHVGRSLVFTDDVQFRLFE